MSRLDRGDHAEPLEPRNVLECDDLRMLDAGTQGLAHDGRQLVLEGIERQAIAGVTNGMDVQLPALARGQVGQRRDLLRRIQRQPAMVGLIAVVLQHRGSATAQGSIDPCLHGAHLQPIVELGQLRSLRDDGARRFAVREHRVDPDRQLLRLPECAIGLVVAVRNPRVVNAGQAQRRELQHRRAQESLQVRIRGSRDVLVDQRHRGIDEYAGGVASAVTHDLPALRIRCRARDARHVERARVDPTRVAIDTRQRDRSIRDGRVEILRGRELLARPDHLVPTLADHPSIVGIRGGELANACHRLGHRLAAAQVRLRLELPLGEHVAVRVDEPGQRCLAARIDATHVRACRHGRTGFEQAANLSVLDHDSRVLANGAPDRRVHARVMQDHRLRRDGQREHRAREDHRHFAPESLHHSVPGGVGGRTGWHAFSARRGRNDSADRVGAIYATLWLPFYPIADYKAP